MIEKLALGEIEGGSIPECKFMKKFFNNQKKQAF